MAGKSIAKRYNTLETLSRLLKFKAVMFKVIEYLDLNHVSAIPETTFYAFVIEAKQQVTEELATEIALVFDVKNLMQARVINDRRQVDGVTCILFNTAIFEVFRLCKVSLFRPLTKVALNTSMSPLWSLSNQLKTKKLSMLPGSEDYKEWVDDLIFRISTLLGNIKANISKLENVGLEFEKTIKEENIEHSLVEARKESFMLASRLYEREIEPLKTFLDKNTRYEEGDGIFLLLEGFRHFFDAVSDRQSSEVLLSYELQFLDLFLPIKTVANTVSIYLQKTQQSICEQSAIENAYSLILEAYNKTLGSDMRNKYIDLKDLSALAMGKYTPAVKRITPFRLDKGPSFLNVALKEIASRAEVTPSAINNIELTELIDESHAQRLAHSLKIQTWVEQTNWPTNTDFIAFAHHKLTAELPEYSVRDLFELQSNILNSDRPITITNDYRTIETDDHLLQYRVRHISEQPEAPST